METLNLPIDRVFEILSDHESYDRFPGVDSSTLLEAGADTRNGKGARRKIRTGLFSLEEDIVGFDAPNLMQYRITKFFPLKINHILGQIELEQIGGKTRANWTSEFEVPIPLIGGILEKQLASAFSQGFREIFAHIENKASENK